VATTIQQEVPKKVYIPRISDEMLAELSSRIWPVYDFGPRKGGRRYIKPVDLRGIAFTWDPKGRGRARNLIAIADVRTYHSFAYHGFFKPSIAEVLAQMPAEIAAWVTAFQIVAYPQTWDDLNRDRAAFDAGYHVATTRFYMRG